MGVGGMETASVCQTVNSSATVDARAPRRSQAKTLRHSRKNSTMNSLFVFASALRKRSRIRHSMR